MHPFPLIHDDGRKGRHFEFCGCGGNHCAGTLALLEDCGPVVWSQRWKADFFVDFCYPLLNVNMFPKKGRISIGHTSEPEPKN